jgi:hypothetical protein
MRTAESEAALERMLLDELKRWTALIPVMPRNPWLCPDEEYDTNAPATPVSGDEE